MKLRAKYQRPWPSGFRREYFLMFLLFKSRSSRKRSSRLSCFAKYQLPKPSGFRQKMISRFSYISLFKTCGPQGMAILAPGM